MKQKLVIFGTGDIAQIANYYFDIDSEYEVVAFTVDRAFKTKDSFEGKPIIDFELIQEVHPPGVVKMFIALSYSKMNKIREEKFNQAETKGYDLISYVSTRCSYLSQFKPGRNCFIFEDNTIQPFVKIGDNVTLWSGNHIGHHSLIESHNFISSHVVVSGHCTIKPNCFIGVNSTIGHQVIIAKGTLVGAGAVITKNTEPKSVYTPAKSIKLDKTSDFFNL
ncbi:MAG: acetyltransferase [Cyclobacteriaceae bacterium]|nr:acetyltransferase [Cyclobacteriaceae bacterium]